MTGHDATFAANRLRGAAIILRAQPARAEASDLDGLSPADGALVKILLAEVDARMPAAAERRAAGIEGRAPL